MVPKLSKQVLRDNPIIAILMISLTAIITHGLLISRLGYYYDDWYMLWSAAIRTRYSLIDLFSIDRPFMGVIYERLYRILGDSILGWHLSTLLLRIAGGIAFYWILNLVWPKLKMYSVLAAMLFVVFPGFLAEPNAATKINHLIGFAAALFSIALTLQAVKTGDRVWKVISIGISLPLMALYLWIYEYMIGLEVMRLTLLFWIFWQGDYKQLFTAVKKTILIYLPNVLVVGAFVFWRAFIFNSSRPATDLQGLLYDYRANYATMLPRLIFQWVTDFFSASTFSWFVQPYTLLAKASYSEILLAILIGLGVALLASAYSFFNRNPESSEQDNPSPVVLILIGVLVVLAAVFPVVLLNRHIDLMDPYKAYALHPSAGAIILVIGLVIMLKPKFRSATIILLLAFSVATQTLNIQAWGNFWDLEKGMWWQLTWRAPDIRDGTLLMAYLPNGYAYQQDYEVWGPVDLIYRPGPEHIPLIPSEVLNQDTVVDVFQGTYSEPHVRDIYVPKDFKNFLLISQPTTSSCIRVIDGGMPAYSTSERPIVKIVGEKSNTSFIDPNATPRVPPQDIFGLEPEHGWCYYFQQASLARQVGDWSKIGELYQASKSAGLKPADPSEYFVFIEGLVNIGRADDAGKIVTDVIKTPNNTALKYSLCTSLASAPNYPASFGYRLDQIKNIVCQ